MSVKSVGVSGEHTSPLYHSGQQSPEYHVGERESCAGGNGKVHQILAFLFLSDAAAS